MSGDAFLALNGAVATDGVIAHFGAPLPEQRALAEGQAVVSLAHRGVVTVAGADRLTWLHSMMSQQLTGLQPGESVETLLLDQQGHIEQVIRLVDDGERAWLLVDEGCADALVEYLNRMRFALRVEVANLSDEYVAVLAFAGGRALAALRALSLAVVEWVDPWAEVQRGGVQYARGDHAGADWSAVQFVFRREDLPAVVALVTAGEVQAAGVMALDALELRSWRPSRHGEVDARAIPHEFDWLRTAVHLNKGCYRGQETVAKVHNLGHPPRRLALLHLDGSRGQLPEPGALIYLADAGSGAGSGAGPDVGAGSGARLDVGAGSGARPDVGSGSGARPDVGAGSGARPVGRVTRSALHYEWGAIALALLKRSVREDALLEVLPSDGERIAATQEVIVPVDAGRTREIPRLKRL